MQLTPHINIDLISPVWRMEIDEQADTLCLETRDAENKTTAFSCIDLNTGKVHFKGLKLPYGWQCGLDIVIDSVMLVHGYQSEILPVRKGLTAIDIKTGDVFWENFNLNIEKAHSGGLEVYDVRIQPKRIFLVSTSTGQAISRQVDVGQTFESNINYPDALDELGISATGLLDSAHGNAALFLSHSEYRILSLHALSAGVINQHLLVYNHAGQVVFEDILARDIQKLQPEAFIVFKDKLIWLQNRSVVKVLHL